MKYKKLTMLDPTKTARIKLRELRLSALLLFVLGLTGLQAQTMYVKESSGTQTAYTLSSVRKMAFSLGNATVQKSDNSIGVFTLSGLRYLSFTDLSTGISGQQIQLGKANFMIYPNPVTDLLYIDLAASEDRSGSISILSFEGKELQKHKTKGTGNVTLNLSQLPQGIYLCRYCNALEIKTLKIIKQ